VQLVVDTLHRSLSRLSVKWMAQFANYVSCRAWWCMLCDLQSRQDVCACKRSALT
jgi:hypothetical protein